MISKQRTLALIKSKVDARRRGEIKLPKRVATKLEVGVFKHTEDKQIEKVFKHGNSVMFIDNSNEVRNINVLDHTALKKILWQLSSAKEKQEIAMEHLLAQNEFLKEY